MRRFSKIALAALSVVFILGAVALGGLKTASAEPPSPCFYNW